MSANTMAETPPTHQTIRPKLTASSLLSSFKPQQSPTSVTQARKMSSAERDLRARAAPVSYVISDDSDDSPSPSSLSDASAFESPDKVKRDFGNRGLKKFEDDDEESEEEEEEEKPASSLPENRSIEGGRSMRPRSVLKAVPTSGHIIFKKKKRSKQQTTSQPTNKDARRAAMTARAKLRDDIEHGTKLQQDRFLLAHKDFFTPLLQDNSYIQVGLSVFSPWLYPKVEFARWNKAPQFRIIDKFQAKFISDVARILSISLSYQGFQKRTA